MDAGTLGDADLARRIALAGSAGAPDAEAELYARLAPRARLYGLRHLRDEQSAADLAQRVLLLTIERLRAGEIREPERLTSFVLGACRMVVLDIKRGSRRRARVLAQFADDLPRACLTDEPRLVGPDDDLVVARLVADLPRVERIDLVTCDAEGHELDRLTDIPVRPSMREVVVVEQIDRLRALPACVLSMTLVTFGPDGGERLLGEYTFAHTPSPR